MFNLRLYFYFLISVFITGFFFSSSLFSQNYVINGFLEKNGQERDVKDSIVRRESLIIKDKRVLIQLLLDEGARNIASHSKRYKEISYLLPKEVVYDDVSKRIFYYDGNNEIEIGRVKIFLGFMPYIALAEGVAIAS